MTGVSLKIKQLGLVAACALCAVLATGLLVQATAEEPSGNKTLSAVPSHDASHTGWTELTLEYYLTLEEDWTNCGRVLPTGNYYLSGDLQLIIGTQRLYVREDSQVALCLNGHTLTSCIIADENAELTVCSCKSGGTIVGSSIPSIQVSSTGQTTLSNITVDGSTGRSSVSIIGGSFSIDGCTLKNLADSDYAEGALVLDGNTSGTIENTTITNNANGIRISTATATLKNVTLKDNTEYDVRLNEATITADGSTTIGLATFQEDSTIELGQDFVKSTIKVELGRYASVPYTVSNAYSDCFVCAQLPYHIENQNGKSVLTYRIDQQPSANNHYEFVLDKNGSSTSEPITDSSVTYQWYEVIKTLLNASNYEVVDFADIDDDTKLAAFAQSAESGKIYIAGSVSESTITESSFYCEVYPQIIFLCKNDSAAPQSVSYSTATKGMWDLYLNGDPKGNAEFIEHPEVPSLKICHLLSAEEAHMALNEVTFISNVALESETTAKLGNPQAKKMYKCIATLSDQSEIESDVVAIAAQDEPSDDPSDDPGKKSDEPTNAVPTTNDNTTLFGASIISAIAAFVLACIAGLKIARRKESE